MGVDVFAGGWALFGCDGEAVEGRYMSNYCAPNGSQDRCFTTFYSVLLYLHTFTVHLMDLRTDVLLRFTLFYCIYILLLCT